MTQKKNQARPRLFRYDCRGQWLKGNTHLHSTVSDGSLEFTGLARLYHGAGYDFLCRTDHWVASRVGPADSSAPLVWLDGVELDGHDRTGAYFHVVCLGTVRRLHPEAGLEPAMRAARRQGALLVLAHPFWTGNTFADCRRHHFDAVEVYNHIAHWLNGRSCGLPHWCAALGDNPETLAIAADDGHLGPDTPGWNGGWVMVNAPERTAPAILDALRRGNFYSSCGPDFRAIEVRDNQLRLATSPVRFARLAGPGFNCCLRRGSFDGPLLEEAVFDLPGDWDFAYAEIEDQKGRRAWTNNLFTGASPA